jgi:hypothetical protein
MANRIQLRRDTTSNWNSVDPILADGEPGYDIVTNEIRIGNGSNTWSELSANTISGGGGASTGNVTFSDINVIGTSSLRLQPNVALSTSYIDIYLTTGPDTHIDTYSANLILGKDSSANVRLATDGNVQIRAEDGGSASTWTFDPDGNLRLPAGGVIVNSDSSQYGEINTSSSVSTLTVSDASGDFQYGQLAYNYTVNGNGGGFTIAYSAPLAFGNVDISVGNVVTAGTANIGGNLIVGGNLLLSAGGQIQSPAGVGNVTIEVNDGNNVRAWAFETNGNITFPDATTQGTAYQRVTGSWTVPVGSFARNFTVPQTGTYVMWVRGTCDNGIITWNATATVTNNNVPVTGQQYAWVYTGGGTPIDFTDIPHQFVGTANTIVRSDPPVTVPTNRFDFVINNTSGSSQTVYWGYVAQ